MLKAYLGSSLLTWLVSHASAKLLSLCQIMQHTLQSSR